MILSWYSAGETEENSVMLESNLAEIRTGEVTEKTPRENDNGRRFRTRYRQTDKK
jgi:hypothetical protein